jgi:hypothetical protein
VLPDAAADAAAATPSDDADEGRRLAIRGTRGEFFRSDHVIRK